MTKFAHLVLSLVVTISSSAFAQTANIDGLLQNSDDGNAALVQKLNNQVNTLTDNLGDLRQQLDAAKHTCNHARVNSAAVAAVAAVVTAAGAFGLSVAEARGAYGLVGAGSIVPTVGLVIAAAAGTVTVLPCKEVSNLIDQTIMAQSQLLAAKSRLNSIK